MLSQMLPLPPHPALAEIIDRCAAAGVAPEVKLFGVRGRAVSG